MSISDFLECSALQRKGHYRGRSADDLRNEVSSRLVGHLLQKLFDSSREQMLVQVLGRRKLSTSERRFLQDLLDKPEDSQ
jgi:hypothetical protein